MSTCAHARANIFRCKNVSKNNNLLEKYCPTTHYKSIVVYFDQRMHACACVCMVENDQKHSKMSKKVPFSSCTQEAHERLSMKNEEKSLLVSDWEWLPKAGWHPNAGCSFGILFFLFLLLHGRLMCMTQNVFWKTMLRKFNILNRAGVLVWVLHSIQ